MLKYSLAFAVGALVLFVAYVRSQPPPKVDEILELRRQLRLERQLRRVKSVTIRYEASLPELFGRAPTRPGQQITVSDSKELQALLDAFEVRATDPSALATDPSGSVEFTLRDGTSLSLFFVGKTWLAWLREPGQVYLKDAAFFDKVTGLVSKKTGRTIDLLKLGN